MPQRSESVTLLLTRWCDGDQEALQALVPLVYGELRQAAHRCFLAERPDHTLQSTALIHEAYVRLAGSRPPRTVSRAHFIAVASRLMRQVLVDYARRRSAAKRGPQCKVELDESCFLPLTHSVDVVSLDQALNRLSQRDPQQEKIVELRFFGGLTVEETAAALDISPATVKRDWNMAKAWLMREVGRGLRGEERLLGAGQRAV